MILNDIEYQNPKVLSNDPSFIIIRNASFILEPLNIFQWNFPWDFRVHNKRPQLPLPFSCRLIIPNAAAVASAGLPHSHQLDLFCR